MQLMLIKLYRYLIQGNYVILLFILSLYGDIRALYYGESALYKVSVTKLINITHTSAILADTARNITRTVRLLPVRGVVERVVVVEDAHISAAWRSIGPQCPRGRGHDLAVGPVERAGDHVVRQANPRAG